MCNEVPCGEPATPRRGRAFLGVTVHRWVTMERGLWARCVTISTLLLLFVGAVAGAQEAQDVRPSTPVSATVEGDIDPFLVELQERTFRFFWDTGNADNGLIPDRYPTPITGHEYLLERLREIKLV